MLNISIDTDNVDDVVADLVRFEHSLAVSTKKSLIEAGRFVQAEAVLRCPIGPTKAQARTNPHYNYDAKKSPGTLRRSIIMVKGGDYVDVGVMRGAAHQYANKIHNMRNKAGGWLLLGPASKSANGTPRVGEKFIDRAYDENEKEVNGFFEDSATREVRRFNNGN